ncbi:TIGR01777 family oxidoreductase [Flavicella marina]|uniref:TIGR01777 family oxidoreductase n=1 Tax=Flavicella marina TaxID=1475951 RepID=UPI0012655CB6|nr:TIGR01777 family oxidoreductase [Flavicella marina]
MNKRILLTGGTGLIGRKLMDVLLEMGYEIAILTRTLRKNTPKVRYYQWDIDKQFVDVNCLEGVVAIIHLVGENVASGRWTEKRKQKILESRTQSTRLLSSALKENKHNVESFVSASATGIYGAKTTDINFVEDAELGKDFLANVCIKWENEVDQIVKLGIRVVKLRTGIVLSKEGGALKKMVVPFQFGLGAALGSGQQYVPWIHIEDLCKMYVFSIENKNITGAYNAIVDNTTNLDLSKKIATTLKRPFFMPNIPAFVLRAVFGDMAVILLGGSQVSPEKIKKEGFVFDQGNLSLALKQLLN